MKMQLQETRTKKRERRRMRKREKRRKKRTSAERLMPEYNDYSSDFYKYSTWCQFVPFSLAYRKRRRKS